MARRSLEKREQSMASGDAEGREASPAVPVQKIRELVQLMDQYNLMEIEWRSGTQHIRLRKRGAEAPPPVPVFYGMGPPSPSTASSAPAASPPADTPPASSKPAEETSRYVPIKSPMVGTFYAAPGPDKPPFVEVGSRVEPETIVCLIEAMKVFNEIPAEVSGTVVKILVENGQPVEYGQPLFLIDPAA
jgi:acetyl-CoA carboxylase biotin carboxyl carrier protein